MIPAGATLIRERWVLRGFIPPREPRVDPADPHEGHRRAIRETWARLAEDRWVVGYRLGGLWHVTVRDGRRRLVADVAVTAEVRDAVREFDCLARGLLDEAAAKPGRWIPAPGLEFPVVAA